MIREGVGEEQTKDYEYELNGMTLYPQRVPQLNLYTVHARGGSVPEALSSRYTSLKTLDEAVQKYIKENTDKKEKAAVTAHKRQRSKEIAEHVAKRQEATNG